MSLKIKNKSGKIVGVLKDDASEPEMDEECCKKYEECCEKHSESDDSECDEEEGEKE